MNSLVFGNSLDSLSATLQISPTVFWWRECSSLDPVMYLGFLRLSPVLDLCFCIWEFAHPDWEIVYLLQYIHHWSPQAWLFCFCLLVWGGAGVSLSQDIMLILFQCWWLSACCGLLLDYGWFRHGDLFIQVELVLGRALFWWFVFHVISPCVPFVCGAEVSVLLTGAFFFFLMRCLSSSLNCWISSFEVFSLRLASSWLEWFELQERDCLPQVSSLWSWLYWCSCTVKLCLLAVQTS